MIKKLIQICLFVSCSIILSISYGRAESKVKLSVNNKSVKVIAGSKLDINVYITIASGWHINSDKPHEDFLIPAVITGGGDGMKLLSVIYPIPVESQLSFSEKPVSVFEGTVNASLTFEIPKNIKVGTKKVTVKLDYQACNNVNCLPPDESITSFKVEIIGSRKSKGNSLIINRKQTGVLK
jgi:DsbC/DsbD-like thiol-disulfide interchange protein